MYQAPDFIKVELEKNNVFSSSCTPGTDINNVDYGGSDLRNCKPEPIAGMVYSNCFFNQNI